MRRLRVALIGLAVLLAACGSTDEGAEGGETQISIGSGAEPGDAGEGGPGGEEADGADGVDGGNGGGNDDDAPAIVGNPDLDMDELAEVAPDAAEALDEIDDIVSIGDCESELVGLAMSYVPADWQCRVLDQVMAGMDGFTLFEPQSPGGLEITIGTPSSLGPPCEMLQACDQVQSLDLGGNFAVEMVELAGIPIIYGTHNSVEAEIAITTTSALSDEDIAFLTMVLDGVIEL